MSPKRRLDKHLHWLRKHRAAVLSHAPLLRRMRLKRNADRLDPFASELCAFTAGEAK